MMIISSAIASTEMRHLACHVRCFGRAKMSATASKHAPATRLPITSHREKGPQRKGDATVNTPAHANMVEIASWPALALEMQYLMICTYRFSIFKAFTKICPFFSGAGRSVNLPMACATRPPGYHITSLR